MTEPATFELDGQQRAAVSHPLAPMLLVAGAGAGKTTVMAQRMVWTVEQGLARPDQLLGLTFTNKAAAHLKQQVDTALGEPGRDATVATYHSFAASLVADHALELGLDPGTQVLDRARAWQLLFTVYDEFRFEVRKPRPASVLPDALALAYSCADHLVTVEQVRADCIRLGTEKAQGRHDLCQVVEAYVRRKRERNLIDFGDQLALAVQLLRDNPDVATAVREQHPVALLDEYQDTNYAQRVLLQLVYPPGSALTAVGDDMQSIYAFRGAHLGNILRFPDHFGTADRRDLTVNYRSGPEVVALANRIQDQVQDTIPKVLEATPGAAPATIECFVAADGRAEAEHIARDIEARGTPWGAYAVLCRKRRLAGPIADALTALDIPVDVVGIGGLLTRPEIVDVVAWLEVLDDPTAGVALVRLLQGPRYRIGVRDLAALSRHARSLRGGTAKPPKAMHDPFDLADALVELDAVPQLSAEARARLEVFWSERTELAAAASRLPVLDLVETICARIGLWGAVDDNGRDNLLRFCDLAERFQPVEGDPGLRSFLEYLHMIEESEDEVAEATPTADDAVRVMTIHQAKGLEFDTVYVPGLAGNKGMSRIFPDIRADNPLGSTATLPWWLWPDHEGLPDADEIDASSAASKRVGEIVRTRKLEEEWRLLYVACTRAERRLVCSSAQWYAGTAEPQRPSLFYRFIAEQTDLVTELFHEPAPDSDPADEDRSRRLREAERRMALAAMATAEPRPVQLGLVPPGAASQRVAPTGLSVTTMVSQARCPRQFHWSVVRPLPRRASAAARLGTDVHRWIELRAGRQLTVLDLEREARSLLDPEPEPDSVLAGDRADARDADGEARVDVVEGLRAAFLATPYAKLDPARVEAAFVLVEGGRVVRGRLDAAYEIDGKLDLVDFKTGRAPAPGDPGAWVQLDLYALAAVRAWGEDPARLRTTYCYLRADGSFTLDARDWDATAVDAVAVRLAAQLAAVAAGRNEPKPGGWCERCDFLAACPDGRATVEAADGAISNLRRA